MNHGLLSQRSCVAVMMIKPRGARKALGHQESLSTETAAYWVGYLCPEGANPGYRGRSKSGTSEAGPVTDQVASSR
ncbi:62da8eee-6bcc-42c5-b31f-e33460192b69 [Thermothielavioides terrestris]|uniref:62da8eee-6bcc-42c5-b31f-e33460192b69 n=1 Tax=Thermothielavioides terrestris TaxID=2587410 RepID=A0A446BD00_9PEZI|nr:62da8eee-6bcc-42c5-b31f-e33460192b69 [Thermothielavioides terrestris]